MNVELIRKRLRDGFRPFAVVTSSGNRYPVPHPEFIFLTQRAVIVADPDGYVVDIDPLHVVALEDLPPQPRTRNGRARRGQTRP